MNVVYKYSEFQFYLKTTPNAVLKKKKFKSSPNIKTAMRQMSFL